MNTFLLFFAAISDLEYDEKFYFSIVSFKIKPLKSYEA
jgi:hypothetical protein